MPRLSSVDPETLRQYRYRKQFLDADRRQLTVIVVGTALALIGTWRNDFKLLEGTSLLAISTIGRIFHVVATVVTLVMIRRVKTPYPLDWISGAWSIITALVLGVTNVLTRLPVGEIQGPTIGLGAATVIFYFAQRGQLCGRVLGSVIAGVALLVMLWHPASTASYAARTSGTLVILLLNIIGVASARSFTDQRRRRFEAERQERLARQELALKNRELALEKEQAESMYRARTAFLAAMSHEFRTPMNAVIGLSDVLVNAPLAPEYREHARTIRDSASSLLVLLNDVLDFAKIDAGKLVLSPVPFDLRVLLGSVVDMMQPTATAKNIALISRFSTELPESLLGDDARLRQVLVNLLSNAIKFTAQGSVTFAVTYRLIDPSVYEIGFSVEDTGIGMTPEIMARLFRPFEQGERGIDRRYGGTGLGLTISQQIVTAMGGNIQVESRIGQGSTFAFKVQLAETTTPAPPAIQSVRNRNNASGSLAILVVDDLPVNRTVARVMLKQLGYEADFADDGAAAVEAVMKRNYDVVFMDLQMPGMSGIEATKCIAEKLAGKALPKMIAMSASVFEEDRAACRAAGMVDFVAKPVDIEKLDLVLSRISGKKGRAASGVFNVPTFDPGPLAQLRQLEALNEPGFVASLCREFLADTPIRVRRMKEAAQNKEWKDVERDAHSLKSSSASLGAMEMSFRSAAIESAARNGRVDEMETLLERLEAEMGRVEEVLHREGRV